MFSFNIPPKWKAALTFLSVVVVTLTGTFADDVFNASETSTVVTQLVEGFLAYMAVYQVKNKGQVNAG